MAVESSLWRDRGRRLAILGAAALALAGCAEGGALSFLQQSDGSERAVSVSDRSVSLIEQDVEAPDIFQVTDRGLWDGRPSLGGIWVAHPDVDTPERVIIRNTENAEFVIGALFRRERDHPGPVLMVSSDAAAALGMLAGAPAKLNVTALRREAAPDPNAEAEAADAAALAAETEARAAETEATLAALPLADMPAVAADPDLDPDSVGDALVPSARDIAPGAGIDDKDKRYLQIGIFSQQRHAERTARVMTAAGLSPMIKTQSAEDATFWRVLIGPADSVFDRTTMLEAVRAEGFAQAFPVPD